MFGTIGKQPFRLVLSSRAVDSETYVRIRAVCRAWLSEYNAQNRRIERLKWNQIKQLHREASLAALHIITSKPWTVQDPFCCHLYCYGEYCIGRRTGLWVPRHVVPNRLSEQDRTLVRNQWWRNGTQRSRERKYGSSDPQISVSEWIHREAFGKRCYVVCSEACHEKVYWPGVMEKPKVKTKRQFLLAKVSYEKDNKLGPES